MAAVARTQQLTLLAAGVAYYGFVSLVPLSLLALVIATSVGGESLAARITLAASDVLTPAAQQLIAEAVTEETGRGGATVVGALGLLWGGSRVLRGLDRAFSQIYGTVGSQSIVGDFGDAAVVAVAVTTGLLVVGGIEAVLYLAPGTSLDSFAPALILLTLVLAFWPLYIVFPDASVDAREAFPGTVLAAIGWLVLGRTFSLYADVAGTYAIYGALGAVFLVLAWLYVGSILVVFGAVLNAVLAGRVSDRQLQSPGPRQIRTEAMTDDATGVDETGGESAVDDADRPRDSARTRDRADDPEALREEIERLRDELESVDERVQSRTVRRETLESELKRYVRKRVRRGHVRGWGPYLVLLYGTIMTLGAFYFLVGWVAIAAMFVVWTSTLGLYVLMVLFGAGISLLDVPGRVRDAIGSRRS